MQRLLTGLGLTSGLLLALFFGPPALWAALVCVMATLGAVELGHMLRGSSPGSPTLLLPPLVLATIATILFGERILADQDALLLGAIVVVLPSMFALVQGRAERVWPAVPWLCFGAMYLAVPSASVIRLRTEAGPWVVFLLIGIIGLGDTAAYYFGKRFGSTKLAPNLSPKKTWVGSVGGVSAAVVFAAVWSMWRLGGIDPWLLGLAGLTQMAGQFGDLLESAMKRTSGIKDSGSILPGHGGVLDRSDALLLAAPVFVVGYLLFGADWH